MADALKIGARLNALATSLASLRGYRLQKGQGRSQGRSQGSVGLPQAGSAEAPNTKCCSKYPDLLALRRGIPHRSLLCRGHRTFSFRVDHGKLGRWLMHDFVCSMLRIIFETTLHRYNNEFLSSLAASSLMLGNKVHGRKDGVKKSWVVVACVSKQSTAPNDR